MVSEWNLWVWLECIGVVITSKRYSVGARLSGRTQL